MAREIPEVVRAAAGLVATVLDETRKLPETLPALPVRAVGMAMQHAMKVQQAYAGLVARGDELLVGMRGESEPGLATFDDEEPGPALRDSAFDRVPDGFDAGVATDVATEGPAGAAAAAVAAPAETARQVVDALTEDAPSTEEVLDELAIDEMVPEAPDTDPLTDVPAAPVATEDADAVERALLESDAAPAGDAATAAEPTADVSTTVDVLTAEGGIDTVEATVTDEGVAAVEAPQDATATTGGGRGTETAATGTNAGPEVAVDEGGTPVAAATGVATDVGPTDTDETDAAIAEGATVDAVGETSDVPTDVPQGGSELSGAQAAGAAPVEGYDSFSIAQLRGRLRGYQLNTVSDLLAYEQATRARDPYLRMLRNRLEKLEEQAVESSPLAPRGT